jgi:hypothetical protein
VPVYQSGKGILVPASQEAGQELSIGHPAPIRPEIGQQALHDDIQRIRRHRLEPDQLHRLYLIILEAGRFDPPV